MIDFEYVEGPFGVPIYYQHLPVNTVSLYWLVFVGSADDESAGGHGIYHWFEHIPSRGTQKYPGGYLDTEARLVRHGGGSCAETGHTYTGFSFDSPKRVWAESLDVLTDMIAQPLLRFEDIKAEREIILQEIDEWHSAPYTHSLCQLPALLWPNHPLGHDQLGTRETLSSIDPSRLQKAHELGYSRGRCAIFVAGDIPKQQLPEVIGPCLERMPDRPISQRRRPASYGALPGWQAGRTTEVQSTHDDSIVYLLFPIPPLAKGVEPLLQWDFLSEVFSAGELGSPLSRMVREDSQLAYSPEFISTTHPDGGYAGLMAQTSVEPERVVEAFWKLIRSPDLYNPDWLDYVRDNIRGRIEMHDPDASEYTEEGCASLVHYGRPLSDKEYADTLLSYQNLDVADWLEQLTADVAHCLIFRGRGDS